MNFDEFSDCVSRLHCWGIHILHENRQRLFDMIDRDNSRELNFVEFSDFVVKMLFETLS